MDLVQEFTYHAMLHPPMPIGKGPFGERLFVGVIGGRIEGPRIKGKLTGAGGDWLITCEDGYGRLDIRAQIETDDGAFIYLQSLGILESNEKVQKAMAAAQATEFEDQYFCTTPRFETGDERYAWLNQSIFIGQGRLYPGFGVEYQVSRVT